VENGEGQEKVRKKQNLAPRSLHKSMPFRRWTVQKFLVKVMCFLGPFPCGAFWPRDSIFTTANLCRYILQCNELVVDLCSCWGHWFIGVTRKEISREK